MLAKILWSVALITVELTMTVIIGGFCWAALTVWP